MANMSFGVNIIPKQNNTYTLGNSDYKWNIFANTINGYNTIIEQNLSLGRKANTTNGEYSTALGYNVTASGDYSFATGFNTEAINLSAFAEGDGTIAGGNSSHAEGFYTQAAARYSHAEGRNTIASNENAHAEGSHTTASGLNSHAEGEYTSATNRTAHAEGYYSTASYTCTHAEGNETTASQEAAHSEGIETIASGIGTHAQGKGTVAYGAFSDVIGKYNIIDSSYSNWNEWTVNTSYSVGDKVKRTVDNEIHAYICKTANKDSFFNPTKWEVTTITNYITIAGNGRDDENRSNAYALDWDGNAFFKGNVYVGANADSSSGSKLATEAYVTTAIANAGGGSGSSTPSNLATVATTGDYGDLINKPDLSQYITAVPAMTGCSSSAAGVSGLVPAPAAGNEDQFLSGDGTWKSGGLPMVILSYGSSTWAQFEAAYKNNVIVYCRASSNSNPASGSQTRMAFMAYVNDATNPANVEFQYYRSMNAHTATQLGDQVFVYKLDKNSGWSVTTRDASVKQILIDTDNAGSVAWSSNKVTLTTGLPKVSASDNGKILQVVNGVWTAVTPS